MPRVNALTSDRKIQENIQRITSDMDQKLRDNRIQYKDVAAILNVTPAAVSKVFRSRRISMSVYLACKMALKEKGVDDEEKVEEHCSDCNFNGIG